MNGAEWTALLGGIATLVTAITGLVKSFKAGKTAKEAKDAAVRAEAHAMAASHACARLEGTLSNQVVQNFTFNGMSATPNALPSTSTSSGGPISPSGPLLLSDLPPDVLPGVLALLAAKTRSGPE